MDLHPLDLSIQLNQLTCLNNGSKGINSPYLWNIFFKIGGSTLRITDNFRIDGKAAFRFSEGSYNNLDAENMAPGDHIEIPPNVGRWETRIHPIIMPHFEAKIPGVVACLCVLMERRNLSQQGAEAGHQFLNDFVHEAINNTLLDFDPKKIDIRNLEESVKVFFERRVLHYTEGLEGKMGQVIRKSQSFFQNLWTLMGKDSMVGFKIIDFAHSVIEESGGTLPIKIRWEDPETGIWEIQGKVESEQCEMVNPEF